MNKLNKKREKEKVKAEERELEQRDMTQRIFEEKILHIWKLFLALARAFSTPDEFSKALEDVKTCIRCNEEALDN